MFWPSLAAAVVLEPGLQPRQHLVQRQLLGRAGVVVAQRHVGRLARRRRRSEMPTMLRPHARRASRSRCPAPPVGAAAQPGAASASKRVRVEHGLVLACRRAGGGARRGGLRVGRAGAPAPASAPGSSSLRQAAEAVALVEVQQAGAVDLAQRQRVERRPARHLRRQVAVGHHGDQLAAGAAASPSALRRFSPTAPLMSVGGGDHAVERAVLGDPLDGGLRPDLLDAGHVVDAVADQRQVVDDALRRHAELGLHGRRQPRRAARCSSC